MTIELHTDIYIELTASGFTIPHNQPAHSSALTKFQPTTYNTKPSLKRFHPFSESFDFNTRKPNTYPTHHHPARAPKSPQANSSMNPSCPKNPTYEVMRTSYR